MKKEQVNCVFSKGVGGGRKYTSPVVLGLVACLCLSSPMNSFAVSNNNVQATQSVQQQKTVKGSILDENGEPMIGVSVVVKGTTTGTITDFDGNFSLNVPANAKTLEISYIGYKTQEVQIGKTPLSIKMQPDNQLLDEVVVIGYGTVKKRDLTGAVTSVKSEDIRLNPGSRPMDALQGKVAGLDITKSSGQAGTTSSVQLRGVRSMQYDDDSKELTGGSPTYIIDGMPGDINTLNPNDIESIEVLKDASSTAVYGSAGANGVIIVTTKQATTGKPVINFDMYAGFTKAMNTMKMRSGESYLNMLRDANRAAGLGTELSDLFSSNQAVVDAVNNNQWINWGDEVLNTGFEQNYSISVTGGTEKTKAYFSLNYSDEESLYKNDNYQVYSTRFRIDQEINQWITAGINAQASYTNKNARGGVYEDALFARPLGVVWNEDGTLNQYPVVGDTAEPNMLADEQPGVFKNNSRTGKIYVDAYVDWKPIKGLSIRSQIGGNYSHTRSGKFQGEGSYKWLTNGRSSDQVSGEVTNSSSYNWKWENILTYNFTLAEDHAFTFTGVTSYSHDRNESFKMSGDGIADNKLLWYGLNNANNKAIANSYTMSKSMGYVARMNYSYKGKYLASVSCRWDGSSRLAKDNRWDSFPAVSLGWRISDESFMERTQSWLDNLKIRVGYGVSGSTSGIGYYPGTSSIELGATALGGEKVNTTLFERNVANPLLTWERSYNLNIGIDASFLNNRIDLTLDYYDTKTKDVIMSTDLPNTMGGYNDKTLYRMDGNFAETRNRGIELALTTRNIVKKNFSWTTNFTFAKNKEEITKLAGGQDVIINGWDANKAWKVGEAVDAFYRWNVTGIWQWSERETAALFGREPGDVKMVYPNVHKDNNGYFYNDKNTNEKVYLTAENPYTTGLGGEDRMIIGKTSPDWTGGIKNTFTYKDFDFSFFIYARWGQMMKFDKVIGKYQPNFANYNIPEYFTYYDTTLEQDQNVLFYAANALREASYSGYEGASDMAYTNGSFWKLKNVTLGYTLPKSICQKFGVSRLRIYGTATNLFVFSPNKYVKDYDPEMNGSIDFPLSSEFVFGLNLTF